MMEQTEGYVWVFLDHYQCERSCRFICQKFWYFQLSGNKTTTQVTFNIESAGVLSDFQKSLTHSLTHSWSWDLLEKPPVVRPLKNFPAFYGSRRFITVFTRALLWSLSWDRSIQFILSPLISLRSTYCCSPTYTLVFLVVSFLPAFPPIFHMNYSSPPFVLHALPISSS
jgi:hypothetical protein